MDIGQLSIIILNFIVISHCVVHACMLGFIGTLLFTSLPLQVNGYQEVCVCTLQITSAEIMALTPM